MNLIRIIPAEGCWPCDRSPPSDILTEGFSVRALIFANGPISKPNLFRKLIRPDDWLIAADGGARHLRKMGLKPAVVIGDFDSLTESELQALRKEGSKLVRHPSSKDQTDLELALRHTLTSGATEILILGAVGDRWDQSLANLLLPVLPDLPETRIWLVDGLSRATIMRSGTKITFEGHPGDIVSLVPLGGTALGVTTADLEYPLTNEPLAFGSTLGISNKMLGYSASVELEIGVLALFITQSSADDGK
jgi:thiamine pyrophosphokinase